MDHKEPAQTPDPTYEEQPKATMATFTPQATEDQALTETVAAMATAMANLMEPTEAAALNDAAATLMKGGASGNA